MMYRMVCDLDLEWPLTLILKALFEIKFPEMVDVQLCVILCNV